MRIGIDRQYVSIRSNRFSYTCTEPCNPLLLHALLVSCTYWLFKVSFDEAGPEVTVEGHDQEHGHQYPRV